MRGLHSTFAQVAVSQRPPLLHPSKDGPLGSWILEKLAVPLYLGAGSHTVRIVGRTPGARIDRFELAPALAAVTPPDRR